MHRFGGILRSVRYPAATSDVEINRTFPKRPHNISESEAWKTATILSSIVSFISFSTIDPLPFSLSFSVFSRAKTQAFTSYPRPVFQYTYANFFALHAPPYRCERGVAFDEGGGTSLLHDPIPKFRFLAEVVSSRDSCFAPTAFCFAQKRTFNREERGNFQGLSRERCYSRGNSNIAFWSKTEFWSRACYGCCFNGCARINFAD